MKLDDFPDDAWPDAWRWLHQFPLANFDDDGPRNLQAFCAMMRRRVSADEHVWGVWDDSDELCGLIGFQPLSPRWGLFHGIVFDQRVHGSGIAREAVRAVLNRLFATGFSKVSAWYFADNRRVHHFLESLGATEEGLLRAQTVRDGVPVDMRLVAFFKEDF